MSVKKLIVFVAALLVAVPLYAQPSLLGDLQAERSHFGTPMSKADVGKMLNDVAAKNWGADPVHPAWVLLSKPSGNNCPSPAGPPISCDYLVYGPTGQGFDILEDSEGAATPTWNRGDSFGPDRFVQPAHVDPPAPVVDQFAIDLTALYAEYGQVPTAGEIAAHRGNPGGLPAIRAMLDAAHPHVTPPADPPLVVAPTVDPDLIALIKATIPGLVDSQAALQASLLGLHLQVAALQEQLRKMATAYVRFDMKPIVPGAPTAGYFKMNLGEPVK